MSSQLPSDCAAASDADTAIDWKTYEQSLLEIEQSCLLLKAQVAQWQTDLDWRQELQQTIEQIQAQMQQMPSKPDHASLKKDLQQTQQRLENLERSLATDLFSQWFILAAGIKELFWQVVRFGGVGILIGWGLRSLVG